MGIERRRLWCVACGKEQFDMSLGRGEPFFAHECECSPRAKTFTSIRPKSKYASGLKTFTNPYKKE